LTRATDLPLTNWHADKGSVSGNALLDSYSRRPSLEQRYRECNERHQQRGAGKPYANTCDARDAVARGMTSVLPRLKVNCQLEAIGKKRLHHQSHLVFRRVSFCPRMNFDVICSDPLRQMSKHRVGLLRREPKLVCELDVDRERKSAVKRPPGSAGVYESPLSRAKLGGVNVPGLLCLIEATSKDILPGVSCLLA
jgi:hypothetical protein